MLISKELTVERDCLGRAQHILADDLSVGQKAEERHLGHAAETNRSGGGIGPLAHSRVMFAPARCGASFCQARFELWILGILGALALVLATVISGNNPFKNRVEQEIDLLC